LDGLSLQDMVTRAAEFGDLAAFPVLVASSVIEYVFPPFPGDTVTLAAAVLARVGSWSWSLVFLALTLGSLVGATLDYWFGRKALSRDRILAATRSEQRRDGIARVLDGYRRFGPVFLVVNRFLPGIRAFFFVAAGMAGIPLRLVLLYSLLSAAAWNAIILYLGTLIGDNIGQLEQVVSTYMSAVWVLLGIAAAALLVRFLLRRRKARSGGST